MTSRTPARVFRARVARLWTRTSKLASTIDDVREGRLSYESDVPIVLSRLDDPRGGLFIIDGHHRAVEALLRGDSSILARIDEHVPRIERTGGAYRSWTDDRVNLFLAFAAIRERSRGRWARWVKRGRSW
jgi:hypothetical protein